jgi:2,5-diketo-D-gluconate reductase B
VVRRGADNYISKIWYDRFIKERFYIYICKVENRNELISIGNEKIPALGLGTYQLTGREGEKSISDAIRIGYRHIDTAQFYRNEDIVGNAVRKSGKDRKEFFITTKIWPTDFTKSKFIPKVEQSLKELNAEYIDLLLLHWPAGDSANHLACDLLNDCLHKGYTRLAGVSNFSMTQLKEAQNRAPVFCNQLEYNPYINQREMLEYMPGNNLLLTAYQPLARGNVNKDAVLIALGEKYKKSPAQIVLRWLLQQKNVSPIPKAGSEKHLGENLNISDFQLSEDDMKSIFNLSGKS